MKEEHTTSEQPSEYVMFRIYASDRGSRKILNEKGIRGDTFNLLSKVRTIPGKGSVIHVVKPDRPRWDATAVVRGRMLELSMKDEDPELQLFSETLNYIVLNCEILSISK